MGFSINLNFKQLEYIHDVLKLEENKSLNHIWLNSQTGEIASHEMKGNWQKIELSNEIKSKVNHFYSRLKKLNVKDDKEFCLDFSATEDLFKNEKSNPIKLLEKCKSVFGAGYVERLSNIKDSISFDEEIQKIAFEFLEGVKPLKDDKIISIHNFLKGFDYSLKYKSDLSVVQIYSLLNDAIQAINEGKGKIVITDDGDKGIKGNNHSYFLTNKDGQKLWVFKPENEENSVTGLEGVKSGEGAKREQVASLVNDHQKFLIPFTAYVEINEQVGSVQLVIPNVTSLSEIRCINRQALEQIEATDLQYIMIYDLMFGNCDGHSGNILCQKSEMGGYKLFSIDHGATLSKSYKDLLILGYTDLKHIAITPLNSEVKEFVKSFDNKNSTQILEKHGMNQVAVDWHNLVCECLKAALNVDHKELFAGDIAFVLMEGRLMILQSQNKIEKFNMLLSEVLNFKKALKTMNLNEQNIQNLRTRMGNSIKSKGIYQLQDFEWQKQLFLVIGNNYCKSLPNNLIRIDY